MPLLEASNLRVGYGELPVLYDVSLTVEEGAILVILGLNGAGKTTTLHTLAGVLRPWQGEIRFGEEDVTNAGVEAMVVRGVVLVPEGRHVFPNLSVEDNLRVGAWVRRRDANRVNSSLARSFSYFPLLEERRNQLAGNLSGGEQQMLAIARGLMGEPKLLLIDEASLGLAPTVWLNVLDVIREINRDGVTVVLNEQNIASLDLADRVIVLQKGAVAYEGHPRKLRTSSARRQELLGLGGAQGAEQVAR